MQTGWSPNLASHLLMLMKFWAWGCDPQKWFFTLPSLYLLQFQCGLWHPLLLWGIEWMVLIRRIVVLWCSERTHYVVRTLLQDQLWSNCPTTVPWTRKCKTLPLACWYVVPMLHACVLGCWTPTSSCRAGARFPLAASAQRFFCSPRLGALQRVWQCERLPAMGLLCFRGRPSAAHPDWTC